MWVLSSRVCILSHFPSTLTFHFNCLGLLLLLPTSAFRPNVNRILWGNFTLLRAWDLQSRYHRAVKRSFRGLLKFQYHNMKLCGYMEGFVSTPLHNVDLIPKVKSWNCQLHFAFSVSFWIFCCLGASESTGAAPSPPLIPRGDCRSWLVCRADWEVHQARVWQETCSSDVGHGAMSGNCKSPGLMIN